LIGHDGEGCQHLVGGSIGSIRTREKRKVLGGGKLIPATKRPHSSLRISQGGVGGEKKEGREVRRGRDQRGEDGGGILGRARIVGMEGFGREETGDVEWEKGGTEFYQSIGGGGARPEDGGVREKWGGIS